VKSIRLFFALWPDEATRAALSDWTEAIHRASGGRAIPLGAVHMTLAFLGDTDPARLSALTSAVARVRPARFILSLDEAGCWNHNNLAWAGTRVCPPELTTLVSDLRAALSDGGFTYDPKPFAPHLTLIRKARRGFTMPSVAPIRWSLDDFVLVRSVLGRAGSEYSIEARWRAAT
jgi:2'-5' RNA ligase